MAADTIACQRRSHEAALAEGELRHSSFPLVDLRHKDSGMEGAGIRGGCEGRGGGGLCNRLLEKTNLNLNRIREV